MRVRNVVAITIAVLSLVLAGATMSLAQHAGLLLDPAKYQDAALQAGLEKILQDQKLQSYVSRKQLALAIIDISDANTPRFAGVNASEMMYAASLPKIAILVAAFVKIERQQLVLDDALWKDMNRMIRNSDNAAATRVLEKVGHEDLLNILQEPRYRFYDREQGGGLWVGKAYSKSTAYRRDPLKNLSHAASPIQAARVYYMLATGQLLGPELSLKMLDVLSNPAINHKLVKGLKDSYPNAKIYRKSGTWRQYHSDSAMIETQDQRYIIVALSAHPDGGKWLSQLATPLMDLMAGSRDD